MVLLQQTVLVVINGVWNLELNVLVLSLYRLNNIYSSLKAYVGKVLVVWDTIHSFRGEELFLTLYIPIQVRVLLAIMLNFNKQIYIHV
jgi:hypothetical protein